MKNLFLLLLLTGPVMGLRAQLVAKPVCGVFEIDILDGKVNGLKPDARQSDIKSKLPCFTSSEEDGSTAKCGGTVFYMDRGIYFYTDRDYIEIKEGFKGKLSIPLMGAARGSMFKWLGNVKLKDEKWDAFQLAYGLLVLHYNKAGKVNLIQFTTKSAETLNLCE